MQIQVCGSGCGQLFMIRWDRIFRQPLNEQSIIVLIYCIYVDDTKETERSAVSNIQYIANSIHQNTKASMD